MPIFNPDPSKVSTGFPVYPKGRYEVELGEPKSFFAAGKNGKGDNYGVRFPGKIVTAADTTLIGKPLGAQCFQHTDPSLSYSKQYQMSALGYNPADPKSEALFNEEKAGGDWGFNTDTGTAGDAWHEMKGKVIVVDLDTKMDESQKEVQVVSKISPL